MRALSLLSGLAAAILLAAAFGLAQNQQQPTATEQPLVRVNVDLVQIDVVVTDSKGHHVADLRPDEFEILDNGKPQRITGFSFIPDAARLTPAAPSPATSRIPSPALPTPSPIRPAEVVRTIAIVVDDLGLSDQSFTNMRPALESFVESQLQPGDLVALVTTSGKLGAFQRISSDPRVLRAALSRLRSSSLHRDGVFDRDFKGACFENDIRTDYYGRLSIAALRRVVESLRELPGRKSILLFSEGLPVGRVPTLTGTKGQGACIFSNQLIPNQVITAEYNALLLHANRSGVAINTIDPRGLIASFETAEYSRFEDASPKERYQELVTSQGNLADIARRTGGIAIANDNDLAAAVARVMSEEGGYYLIAYKPSEPVPPAPPGSPRLRRLAVRVTRPGLKLRFHSSLYADAPQAPATPAARLAAAALSPFSQPGIRLRCSSRFWDSGPSGGPILETALRIDPRDLVFTSAPDGRRKASFDVVAVIFGAAAKPLDTFEKSYAVSLTDHGYEAVLSSGLVQQLQLALKRPGAYQIRAAVRDIQSDRIGSASEFVEVPDLVHAGLTLSGIALSADPGAPSRIRYRPGQTLYYAYQVLNASPARDGSFNVEVQAALFRDGRTLGSSKLAPADMKDQRDLQRLVVTGDLRLGPQLPPGDYTLQVTTVDRNAPARRATAVQSIDFEVAE